MRRVFRLPVVRLSVVRLSVLRLSILRVVVLAGLPLVLLAGCGEDGGAGLDSAAYEEAVSAFHTGVAALQVGEDVRAEASLSRVAELLPSEPAAAANLALLALEQRRLDEAADWLERARAAGAAEEDPSFLLLAALVARERGRLDEAIELLRTAVAGEEADPRARFLLHRLLELRGAPDDRDEARSVLDSLIASQPDVVFLRIESARHAVRAGEEDVLERELAQLREISADWPERSREQLSTVEAARGNPAELGTELTFLSATLDEAPWYRSERERFTISEQQPDLVFSRFLSLPMTVARPAEPDLGLEYSPRPVELGADFPETGWGQVRPLWLDGSAAPGIVLAGAEGAILAHEGEARRIVGPATGGVRVVSLDLDGDFAMDLALTGSAGVRLFGQGEEGSFHEIAADLPERARSAPVTEAWAVDVDVDGDVDLVVAPPGAPPFLLRNRGDGGFEEAEPFEGIGEVTRFAWGDLDRDGVPDAVLLDSEGSLHVQLNPRQDAPTFRALELPSEISRARAMALGDLHGEGVPGLVVLREDGAIVTARLDATGWTVGESLAEWPDLAASAAAGHLFLADLDNNGALDVAASLGGVTRTWLTNADGELVPHRTLDFTVTAAADLSGGRVQLLGVDPEGRPLRYAPQPTRDYYALTISPRATEEPGDGRINPFGLGGEAEIRAGLLYQKQLITEPFVHFGLGTRTGANVARIIWPNGTSQAEFDLLATSGGQPIVAEQRLKGSCPWLFAFDGAEMAFVTDIAWRTALGLRINAYGSSAVIQSQDWVRLRGHQLEARDGAYELSITADLWESHFFDHVALDVIDHPSGTEALVDERFFLPPPELEIRAAASLRPLAGARDHRGRDITATLAERDGTYVDGFELGRFQGAAGEEHWVELDLGTERPGDAPLLLVAEGWVFPTDGSLNLAMGQGAHEPPRGIRVEVPDEDGGWRVLHEDLGMPAGKEKTVLVELDGAFPAGVRPRVRLATTMEIYWDRVTWTESLPEAGMRVTRLLPETADLRPRGFSRTTKESRRHPEIPEWDVATTVPRWRDLEGYYTRFGDVRPLLREIDDRYVIMNAGDEISLRFPALPDPPEGWTRTYVFVSEAWVKDGDLNNGFSSTVLPLPYRGMPDYDVPPGRLEDDPVYQKFPEDWKEYHTRYVSPNRFDHVLSIR